MNKKLILALVVVVVLMSGLMSGYVVMAQAQSQKPITWTVSAYTAPGTGNYELLERFCNRVNEASGGRLTLKLFGGGAIVPSTKEFDGITSGVLDACSTSFTYVMDKTPVGSLLQAACGGMDAIGTMSWYLGGDGAKMVEKVFEKYNVKILHPPTMYNPEIWCHSNTPINSPEDLKGLKIRTAGDGGAILSKLGASVVLLPGGEVYEAMQRGVIDAFEYGSPEVDWSMGFQEVAKYVYVSSSRAGTEGGVILVNKERWEELPLDLQKIVDSVAKAVIMETYAIQQKRDYEALQKFKDYGCEVLKIPASVEYAFAEVAKEFYDEQAAKNPLFAEVLQSYRDYQEIFTKLRSLQTPAAE